MHRRLLRPPALAAIDQLKRDVPQHWGVPDDDLDVLAAIAFVSRSQRILQFGTAYGLSAVVLADIAAQNGDVGKLITVDPDVGMSAAARRYCDAALIGGIVETVEGLSTDAALLRRFAAMEWDLIFVDTTHQYDQTRDELTVLTPLCSERTLLVLHDASQHAANTLDTRKQGGVARAIREFVWLNPRWQVFAFQEPSFGKFGVALMQKRAL